MGTQSGGNGGGWPPDELPDLPPEWGTIVIPDDASELAREAARVRRELRWEARERRWRRRLHLPHADPRPGEEDIPALGVPVLVILIATIATLTSLFVISWPINSQRPDLQPTAVITPSAGAPAGGGGEAGIPSAEPGGSPPTSTGTPHALATGATTPFDPAHVTLVRAGGKPAPDGKEAPDRQAAADS
ncbi:hypothetical protein HC028_04985 [Planosporangium flavigriseum]|uniref:Uncharacterized protein n=1 Tax=Planosporangium flavigriseum TaxID=373681 RepID=A0A8J3LYV7_9ACTN|nr:hypothetical protein [Planosporangium flavigriseum]NJC63863.1 hypothetical protein [Planosporangium flavigriseum]GIG75910.1 hypothetical protein Pfl04_43140 [Planosporangium flavigriseum]